LDEELRCPDKDLKWASHVEDLTVGRRKKDNGSGSILRGKQLSRSLHGTMLMAEADGSNDKRASFSAILKSVGGPLLSQTDAIPDELSANLTLRLLPARRPTGSYPETGLWEIRIPFPEA